MITLSQLNALRPAFGGAVVETSNLIESLRSRKDGDEVSHRPCD